LIDRGWCRERAEARVSWRVEILNETVAAEIGALPADMQARFLRLAERIGQAGLESLSEPHVRHLEGFPTSQIAPVASCPATVPGIHVFL